jgi:co-chaperonin GroES (HSP10)
MGNTKVKERLEAAKHETNLRYQKSPQRLRLRNDSVLIEHDASEKRTMGGLLLPQEKSIVARQGVAGVKRGEPEPMRYRYGWVRGLGQGDLYMEGPLAGTRVPWDIEVGDYIMFLPAAEHSAQPEAVDHDGKSCLLVPDGAVVAVVE